MTRKDKEETAARSVKWPLWPWKGKASKLMSCELCGCLVTDQARHIHFHTRLAS